MWKHIEINPLITVITAGCTNNKEATLLGTTPWVHTIYQLTIYDIGGSKTNDAITFEPCFTHIHSNVGLFFFFFLTLVLSPLVELQNSFSFIYFIINIVDFSPL